MAGRPPKDAEALFEHVVSGFSGDASVTPPSGGKEGRFGASGLKVGGKLFAMLAKSSFRDWGKLAAEARQFVAAGLPGSRRPSRR
jgi:hypothetical protein